MILTRVVEPSDEPVTVREFRDHSRVELHDDDALIEAYLQAAREYVEGATRRSLMPQTWRLSLSAWPQTNWIELPRPPLQSVTSVIYIDEAGQSVTVDSDTYIVDTDSEPGRIVLANDAGWPWGDLQAGASIRVTYVAGYAEMSAVPQHLRQAIRLLAAHWYENREATAEVMLRETPLAVKSLIYLNRVY